MVTGPSDAGSGVSDERMGDGEERGGIKWSSGAEGMGVLAGGLGGTAMGSLCGGACG